MNTLMFTSKSNQRKQGRTYIRTLIEKKPIEHPTPQAMMFAIGKSFPRSLSTTSYSSCHGFFRCAIPGADKGGETKLWKHLERETFPLQVSSDFFGFSCSPPVLLIYYHSVYSNQYDIDHR